MAPCFRHPSLLVILVLLLAFGGCREQNELATPPPPLVTVSTFSNQVSGILGTLPEKCPKCQGAEWKTEDGTHIVCGGCGEAAEFESGDDIIRDWLKETNKRENIFPTDD